MQPSIDLPNRVGLLFSGGIDSTILLHALLEVSIEVTSIYVHCGFVWEEAERRAVARILNRLECRSLLPLVELSQPLGDLVNEHWSTTGKGTPDEFSRDEAVYLPGRNAALCFKAAMWCQQNEVPTLALATLANNPFADATAEFAASFSHSMAFCGKPVRLVQPFASFTKDEILARWPLAPIELAFSCIAPQKNGDHCQKCNKCAERKRAMSPLPTV